LKTAWWSVVAEQNTTNHALSTRGTGATAPSGSTSDCRRSPAELGNESQHEKEEEVEKKEEEAQKVKAAEPVIIDDDDDEDLSGSRRRRRRSGRRGPQYTRQRDTPSQDEYI